MRRPAHFLVLLTLALVARSACAVETIEFVAEHLAEIAMDNRYASLPIWNDCDDEASTCVDMNAGYARTRTGTLSAEGPLLSLGVSMPVGETHRITGFAFFDELALGSGVERRPLEVLFANPPLTLPADAEFTGLDGSARDIGFGLAMNGSAHWNWLPWFEWSAGLIWQRVELSDYAFDYRITSGPDAGTTGILDYNATYTHVTPFVGAAWPRARGNWRYSPHVQAAYPYPRHGFAGHITGPGFDLSGDTAQNGHHPPFGDPSLTIGFDVTYEPWDLTVDLGTVITQAVIEPVIHEGVDHNLMLAVFWTF